MQQVQDAVNEVIREMSESGEIKKLVEAKVRETVKATVSKTLESYSDFGKQLEAVMRDAFKMEPTKFGFEDYNQTVLAIVRSQIEGYLEEEGKAKVKASLERLLGEAAPKEMKLSELIVEFKKHVRRERYDRNNLDDVTIILEDPDDKYSTKMRWLYLDADPRKQKYQCKFRLLFSGDGNVTLCSAEGVELGKTVFFGTITGFVRTLFRIHAAGTKVIVDEVDISNRMPDPEDDEESDEFE